MDSKDKGVEEVELGEVKIEGDDEEEEEEERDGPSEPCCHFLQASALQPWQFSLEG